MQYLHKVSWQNLRPSFIGEASSRLDLKPSIKAFSWTSSRLPREPFGTGVVSCEMEKIHWISMILLHKLSMRKICKNGHSINQPKNRSNNQSVNQSIESQPINRSTNQSINQTVNRTINQSIGLSVFSASGHVKAHRTAIFFVLFSFSKKKWRKKLFHSKEFSLWQNHFH